MEGSKWLLGLAILFVVYQMTSAIRGRTSDVRNKGKKCPNPGERRLEDGRCALTLNDDAVVGDVSEACDQPGERRLEDGRCALIMNDDAVVGDVSEACDQPGERRLENGRCALIMNDDGGDGDDGNGAVIVGYDVPEAIGGRGREPIRCMPGQVQEGPYCVDKHVPSD